MFSQFCLWQALLCHKRRPRGRFKTRLVPALRLMPPKNALPALEASVGEFCEAFADYESVLDTKMSMSMRHKMLQTCLDRAVRYNSLNSFVC